MSAAFTEEWLGKASVQYLAELASSVNVDGLIIEVGSWEGRSTVAIANAVHPRIVHAVDTWAGSPGEISRELAAERDVHATFQANIAAATKGNVTEHRMDWRDYFATIDEPIAFCFIDATHTFEEVRDNIAAVLNHLATGGIVCGDDIMWSAVRDGVVAVLDPFTVDIRSGTSLWSWRK